jgi:hypothetical protein
MREGGPRAIRFAFFFFCRKVCWKHVEKGCYRGHTDEGTSVGWKTEIFPSSVAVARCLSSFHIGPHPIKSLYSGMQAPVAPCNSLPNGEKRENFNLIPSELTSTMAKRAALGESCTRSEGSGLLNCPKACLRQARMQQTAALNTFIRSEKLRTSLSYNQRIWWRTSACSTSEFSQTLAYPQASLSARGVE